MTRKCELERLGRGASDTIIDLYDGIMFCGAKATDSVIIKSLLMGNRKYKYVLCKKHFLIWKEADAQKGDLMHLGDGCDCELHGITVFRENRL